MAPRFTVSIPEDLQEKMQEWKDSFNYSAIFQEAVRKAIERKENFQEKMKGGDPDMEQVIERLRKEKEGSEEYWFEAGKDEGLSFGKHSHYDEIQIVLGTENLDVVMRELTEHDEYFWADTFNKLRAKLGIDDSMDLEDDSRFEKWERGFLMAVQEFWNEVKGKL